MRKRRVVAGRLSANCHGISRGSGDSESASSAAVDAPKSCAESSTSTALAELDLDGFDLTDFARFLREAAPDWVAETSKQSPVGRPLKR